MYFTYASVGLPCARASAQLHTQKLIQDKKKQSQTPEGTFVKPDIDVYSNSCACRKDLHRPTGEKWIFASAYLQTLSS